jgi:hypothetical protein
MPRPEGNLWTELKAKASEEGRVPAAAMAYTAAVTQPESAMPQNSFKIPFREAMKIDDPRLGVRESEALMYHRMSKGARAIAAAWIAVEEMRTVVQAHASRVKAKDQHSDITPHPKGIKGLTNHCDSKEWQESFAAEIDQLTKMGTITHMHSKDELKEMGIDIEATPPVHTQAVFDNKVKPDAAGVAELDKRKSRLVVDGNPTAMQKGVHYDESFSATPKLETCRLLVCIRVLLQLEGLCFDVSNAYAWAKISKPLALRYPRGMQQFGPDGEERFMALWKNTYGLPDGGYNWAEERNSFMMSEFNKTGWSIHQSLMDQCLFYIKLRADVESDETKAPVVAYKETTSINWSKKEK